MHRLIGSALDPGSPSGRPGRQKIPFRYSGDSPPIEIRRFDIFCFVDDLNRIERRSCNYGGTRSQSHASARRVPRGLSPNHMALTGGEVRSTASSQSGNGELCTPQRGNRWNRGSVDGGVQTGPAHRTRLSQRRSSRAARRRRCLPDLSGCSLSKHGPSSRKYCRRHAGRDGRPAHYLLRNWSSYCRCDLPFAKEK